MKRFTANDLKQIARNAMIHYAVVWGGLVLVATLRYAYVVLVHGVSWQLNADGSHTTISQYLNPHFYSIASIICMAPHLKNRRQIPVSTIFRDELMKLVRI